MASEAESKFDREVRLLFGHLKSTLLSYDSFSARVGKPNPFLLYLNKYVAVYEKTKPAEHFDFFEEAFLKNRAAALNTLNNKKWLRDGQVEIVYGDTERRIKLSVIYSLACRLAEEAQKRCEKLKPGEDPSPEDSFDQIRPDVLLLHLFRIFALVSREEGDAVKISKIVGELETVLGSEETPPPVESGGLLSLANNLLKSVGVAPPPGAPPITEAGLKNALESMLGNEQVQGVFKGVLSSVQGKSDIGEILSSLLGNLSTNPEIKASMASVANTVVSSLPPPERESFTTVVKEISPDLVERE